MQDQAIIDGCSRTMTCTVKDQTELLAISKSVSNQCHMLHTVASQHSPLIATCPLGILEHIRLFYRITWISHFVKQGSATRRQNTLPSASVYLHSQLNSLSPYIHNHCTSMTLYNMPLLSINIHRSVSVLKYWPVHLLEVHPDQCKLVNFK